jgi:hypothetical protein
MERTKQIDILILLGIAKLLSEQSTFLIGEFKRETKQQFNLTIKQVDQLIKSIESGLNDHNRETLQILTDALNDGVADLRKNLNNAA